LFAKKIDFFEKESFFDSVLLKSLTSIFFLFFNFHTFLLFINQTYSKITQNLFDNSFKTLIQKKSKKTSPILFSTAKEMILCFTEFFILIIFSIVAYYVQEKVFI